MSDVLAPPTDGPVALDVDRTTHGRFRILLHNPNGLIGLILLAIPVMFVVVDLLGLLPYEAAAQDPQVRLQAPSWDHWFGTDQFGRDMFARVAGGVTNSLLIAVIAVTASAVVGTLAGLVAGFFGGIADRAIGGVSNIIFAFPALLLAMSLASVLDRSRWTVSLAIAVVYVPIFMRVVRGPVLSLREIEFVKAATSTGQSRTRVMLRHVLPNVMPIVIVQVTLSLSWAVLTEAALSYLGLGAPPPAPSLGVMIFDARSLMYRAPWTMIFPGVVVVLVVVSLNLLGDGLRDTLDPRAGPGRRSQPMSEIELELDGLTTEAADERFARIDRMSTLEVATLMNEADRAVPAAVQSALPAIAAAVDAIAARMADGGRLIYVGAGTSGRLGVLDVSECGPTFGTRPDDVVAVMAGGIEAFVTPLEGAEDDTVAGVAAIDRLRVSAADAVVGIASSGRTPYVLAAVARACEAGAVTVGLSCNSATALSAACDHAIEVPVGPEVIAGSTRLKAGTAQKLVLNMLSTIVMVRLGKTFGNLMVDLRPTNAKLRVRAAGIVAGIAGVETEQAAAALDATDYDVKSAVLVAGLGVGPDEAQRRLATHHGRLRDALEDEGATR